ncbi:FG-GAP repeat domain-containing protein [Streptomyces shenzhenensis]|uniref:FG-GAP repeat domain-containing protein n=1 Tax=Streptomyces shenzhenensis TaxID=943815 RepID=UPI0015F04DAB|nr:VCBS repeat-containing protein [Streptomyces shenzhenensis]
MGRSTMPSGRLRATATALTAVSLVLGGTGLPTASAADLDTVPPWTAPTTLSSDYGKVQDVVVRADGTVVAAWISASMKVLYAATRAPGTDTWSAPVALDTGYAVEARLTARTDGTVAAVWTEDTNVYNQGTRLAGAVLTGGTWSSAHELVGTGQRLKLSQIDLAPGPGGLVAAVWTGSTTIASRTYTETYATTLAADGTWATAEQVSDAASHGALYRDFEATNPQVAVDAQGGLVVAYAMGQTSYTTRYVVTTARPASGSWQAPAELSTTPLTASAHPTLATGPSGGIDLLWRYGSGTDQTLALAHRQDAGSAWGDSAPFVSGVDVEGDPEPLVAPDGDTTVVWADPAADTVNTVTHHAGSATPATRILSTGHVSGTYGLRTAMAPDGSVHALWREDATSTSTRQLMEATLRYKNDTWTDARTVGSPSGDVDARIAARSLTDATAVWNHPNGSPVLAARTTFPKLAAVSASVPTTVNFKKAASWAPKWQTNGPVTAWKLTLTDRAGRTLRTLTGTPGGTTVAVSWNGRTTSGAWAVNGDVTWTLTATQPGYSGTAALAAGALKVTGAVPAFHDYGDGSGGLPDGAGDLLTLDAGGRIWLHYGSLNTVWQMGSGWPTTMRPVALGDLSGDGCGDVLVRLSSGAARLYRPACGGTLHPATPYTTLATGGWNHYDVLTSPGDLTKDGRPDLIARDTATGAVYLYKGTSTGKLSARVKLYANWKTYKKVVGAGDLNGDGIGDLLAQDKSNNLYRYYGKGDGTFSGRVKIAGNWGASYNVVLGVGDVTGDGKADLVARDSAYRLYRQNGTGKGTFGARVLVNNGGFNYKALF